MTAVLSARLSSLLTVGVKMSSALSSCPRRALTCVSVRVTDRQTATSSPVCTERALLFQSRRTERFSESRTTFCCRLEGRPRTSISPYRLGLYPSLTGERSRCPFFTEGWCGCTPPPIPYCLLLHVVGQWFTVTLAVITADRCCLISFFF